MAKTKKRRIKLFNNYSDSTIFVVVLLLATLGVVTWLFANLTDEINQHRALENLNNQACMGLSVASESGIELNTKSLYATSSLLNDDKHGAVANQRCLVEGATRDEEIHGRSIDGYSFGADVTYFKDRQSAKDYEKNYVNPLRYWHPDDTFTNFSFLVTHRPQKYFDAYSVKKNAVIRISLPCNDTGNENKDLDDCGLQADRIISLFNKKLSLLRL